MKPFTRRERRIIAIGATALAAGICLYAGAVIAAAGHLNEQATVWTFIGAALLGSWAVMSFSLLRPHRRRNT